jgi:hypothetical protein
MDVFYAVESGEGGKIVDPARREQIRARLLEAFTMPEAPMAGGVALARAPASSAR